MKKLVVVLLTFLLITGCNTVKVVKIDDDLNTDSIKFSKEYPSVSEDNVFKYNNYENITDTIKDGTGIIYLGFPTCTLCKEIVPIINESAKDNNISEIQYYNFKDIRDNNTEEYTNLLNMLSEYTVSNEDDKIKKLTGPTIIFVGSGEIKGIYIGKINENTEEIITDEQKKSLKDNFDSLIKKMRVDTKNSTSKTEK